MVGKEVAWKVEYSGSGANARDFVTLYIGGELDNSVNSQQLSGGWARLRSAAGGKSSSELDTLSTLEQAESSARDCKAGIWTDNQQAINDVNWFNI